MNARTGKVALVTGGSRGIGRATALRLAADGHDVAFCYRSRPDAAEELEKELAALGARSYSRQTDVADLPQVRDLVAAVTAELGGIDIVVTSAGIVRDQPLLMMKQEDWREVMDTNLDGTFHVCRSVVFEMMKRKSGCIITLSSVSGVYGNPTQSNYSASKAGVIGFTKALAKEVGRYGIRANVVAPGFIETDMTAELPDAVRTRATENVALRRLGRPEEVADAVSYLVGAQYVTGSVLQVDGGIVL
ncbi:3-oxoacyl-[acyl-carrier-protein] reductase [Streptomyces rubellomurinus]|uniref:3-oxoacyl-[acyl-carrier-protein] reductase n=2 Tax=Streptomyces TaxID=1883 RepID=A0A0F2TJ21_STRR3|nr:3-oxoacyl-[acyl-carrier-protein] reductase [Streptomyces rubellomurinus]KJS52819.1 3-oxoacyl-ACP reductase [Streptomyces rubellomurinus subsp. indigoferus]KJS62280.1 3-oxoacyl-ACP reductase [Streptomyces rubellomurinus]